MIFPRRTLARDSYLSNSQTHHFSSMTVRGQGGGGDEASGGKPSSEGGSEPTKLSIDRQQPNKQTSSRLLAATNASSKPAPLTWYASLVKSHSPPAISTTRAPSPVIPLPWTSTEISQTNSPTSSLSTFAHSFYPHESPPTRAASPSSSPTNAPGRHQSIPISFLIHPVSESPRRPRSFSSLPSSEPTSPSPLTNQSGRPPCAQFPPKTPRDYGETGAYIPAADYRIANDSLRPSRPSRSPSVDPAKFSSASAHAHLAAQDCWGSSESEHLRDIEAPHLQRHVPKAFSDQAPGMTSCSRLRSSLYADADSERRQTEEKEECATVASDLNTIESHASEEDTSESTRLPELASVRRASNPNLKTTKTGKIRHKARKIGVNKKSTAYNRFLQQRSKVLAEQLPNLTPQQVLYSYHQNTEHPAQWQLRQIHKKTSAHQEHRMANGCIPSTWLNSWQHFFFVFLFI